jgi:uncharacterized membrane protein
MSVHAHHEGHSDLGTTKSGLDPTVAAALAYLLGFVSGILFYIVEKHNPFVRFHGLQSTIFFGGLFVIVAVLHQIPILGFILNFIILLTAFVIWLFLMVKASQGIAFKLPFIGDLAERNL